MNIPHDSQPEPVLLIIADISGYTRYMTANAKTLAHSQTIITELVRAIVDEIKLPLEVAKLEGDAVFLVCRKNQAPLPWPETKRMIGDNLLVFFRNFSRRLGELSRSVTCTCNACTHIEKLKLKIIIHSGEALFHRVLNFVELAGVDVIIVHRLLKNTVAADQYLLLTEAAHRDVAFTEPLTMSAHREIYDDIGLIQSLVYLPAGENLKATLQPMELPGFGARFSESWKLFVKLWFAPIVPKPAGLTFHHVSNGSTGGGRFCFGALMLLLTPLFLPVGAVFACLHALKNPAQLHHHADGHVHKADGSCCGHH